VSTATRLFRAAVAAGVLLFAAAASAQAPSSAPDSRHGLAGAPLAQALRQGGLVIYFRHAATDMTRSDTGMTGFADCANQRPLSDDGRDAARRIGEAIRAVRAASGDVLSSPMCRTMETARLMFGDTVANDSIVLRGDGEYPALANLFRTPVAGGRNRWIVGHGIPFRALAGPPHLQEGEAAVLRPDGRRWVVVARLLPGEWHTLR
jgi:hypothetical protein